MSNVKFAVVGHPNKGKSSIVSTLSRNDAVAVSNRSGTTTISDEYKVRISNTSYSLIDTPGFQRPRQLLHLIKASANDASQRSDAIRAFLADNDSSIKFPDEVELLAPIMAGAAIIYVVDGSHPYGPEYEAEMEILRWCGQPRLAIVNPIHNDNYIGDWRNALDQYFSLVQVFDPFKASIEQQAMLLESFRVIAPDWGPQLVSIADAMKLERIYWRQQSADAIAAFLIDVCSYQVEQKLVQGYETVEVEQLLKMRYEKYVLAQENALFAKLVGIYKHAHSKLALCDLHLPPDLFDTEQWYLWGLNKTQLIMSMTVGGILAGGSIDLAVGGASFMAGSVVGGVSGLVSGVASTLKLDKFKIKGIPLAGNQYTYGPLKDANYPYVLINRAVHLYAQISSKNHADRSDLDGAVPSWDLTMRQLSDTIRKKLQLICSKLSRQRFVPSEELSEVLEALLKLQNK